MSSELSVKFAPRYLFEETIIQQGSETWIPFIEVDVVFSLEIYFQVMIQLALNPQQTSSTVLRADILIDDTGEYLQHPPNTTTCFRRIRRILIPRRSELDSALIQDITFHRSPFDPPSNHVIYTALVDTASSLPYYHPKVRRLLFSYHATSNCLRLSVLPFPSAAPFTTTTHLSSSLTTLLRTVHRFGHGTMRGYTQRVHHDILVSKSRYQDTYAQLKSKYCGWVERWRGEGELCTDPQKHVFEDIGIAAWLILLWERMEPRPRRFVDIGAGNGFLVHILNEEGYDGYGIEMRPRKIWELYGEKTKLVARTIDPRTERVEDGTFLIGNHADELTAWIPIISALSGPLCFFVLIPCCFYSLVGRFNQPILPKSGGRYRTYQIYLQGIAEQCGYKVEYESLRIPSTKNVALVGREKKHGAEEEEEDTRRVVEDLLREAGEGFVPRVEDGKVRKHQR